MKVLRILLLCAAASAGTVWCADYDLSISQPARIGNVKLEPGRYKLRLQGSVVILTELATNRSSTVLAKVEKAEKPATFTMVQGDSTDGVEQVQQIVLAGAPFRLRFGQDRP